MVKPDFVIVSYTSHALIRKRRGRFKCEENTREEPKTVFPINSRRYHVAAGYNFQTARNPDLITSGHLLYIFYQLRIQKLDNGLTYNGVLGEAKEAEQFLQLKLNLVNAIQ